MFSFGDFWFLQFYISIIFMFLFFDLVKFSFFGKEYTHNKYC